MNSYSRSKAISVRIRRATLKDACFLFRLRNDPVVRENFFHPDSVSWKDHVRWLATVLGDPKRHLFVGIDRNGMPFGQIRFDVRGTTADISVSVHKSARGKGLGTPFVLCGISFLKKQPGIPMRLRLRAQMKRGNLVSVAVFQKAGFSAYAGTKMHLFLRRYIS
jgi:UDP-2,4-diacetamido-2,4,6-trideoxy-beta-L-altropyranose hydrolase